MLQRPLRMIMLGAPGAGKGTQTERLLKKIGPSLTAMSSGDLLRSNIAAKTPVGLEAQEIIKAGKLVPDKTMISLITAELEKNNWLNSKASWLLDGFPRTKSQAEALDSTLSTHDCAVNFVVDLVVPERVILERIENRWVHVPSGRVYNLTYNPPKVPGKDDITGEPLSKRADDDAETFKKRLDAFRETTEPLKEYYRSRDDVFWEVHGETSDEIYPQLEKEILRRFG
ncbi:hypothetical protein CANCADRAFT_140966 [Tortispora caseinolytica NRRL Y-17796]|uniref:GTP:AMP phosphotransferase, mitochondrial n=1 Tax=Tortispora caseinolytica NRRL Y-17796 TaxID=767744 RepID=A0A1E4TCT0_9ASCO|nr:hypothetical protein CANCADRAFT_140966 [Tortispora caseinolytica NRRL Y-17796]